MSQSPSLLTQPTPSRSTALPPVFGCSRSNDGLGAAWIHVSGQLDVATASQLKQTLAEAQSDARLIVLDLRELVFMDTAGVHVIVDASAAARRDGRRVVLVRAPDQVHRMFALTGTSADIDVVELDPGEPPLQALVRVSRLEHRRAIGSIGARSGAQDVPRV
jgi:anti-sigma B factor antagonist